MQKSICSAINFILRKFGLTLQDYEATWERAAFSELYQSRIQYVASSSDWPAECVVFSRDRALQLHALLSSCMEKVTPRIPFHVLFHASTPAHQKAYEEVRELFSHTTISFVQQDSGRSFRSDLIALLQSIRSESMFFLVDDIVFTENFDIRDFAQLDTDKFVPTLRMGLNLKKCYTIQKEQPLPHFTPGATKEIMTWTWGEGLYDWAYPLSVDGHFFSTHEMTTMIRLLDFSAPNTLEDQLQKFRRFFLLRTGICYRKSKIVNIPCNKVQNENKNIHGTLHQDLLLERWQQGYQMDFRSLYGFVNESAHQEIPFD
ncbi:MAG: hypothetical protein JRD89_13865, partial [Deltaproteobacteria bacterium]|nr:hypothetical protein [Deltaproteobacteria bacterium]